MSVVTEDLQSLTLWQLRQRFRTEHESANMAIEDGDLHALEAALSRGRLYMDELWRRIVLHGASARAPR